MSNPDPGQEEQNQGLNDEARTYIGRARRSFGFSIGILLLGFIAIVLALVYRSTREEDTLLARLSLDQIHLPAGAVAQSVVPAGDDLMVTALLGDNSFVYVVDGGSGEVVKEILITADR